jgi:aldose sugar dehydrogenase
VGLHDLGRDRRRGLSATHLGRAQLDLEERALTDLEVLYVAEPFMDSDAHFGSRIVFDDNRFSS